MKKKWIVVAAVSLTTLFVAGNALKKVREKPHIPLGNRSDWMNEFKQASSTEDKQIALGKCVEKIHDEFNMLEAKPNPPHV